MIKANKGEWAEFYAFLKILVDRHIPAADENLSVITDKFFIFRKIFRLETHKDLKIYDITSEDKARILILDSESALIKSLNITDFKDKLYKIFNKIKDASETTFILNEAQELMNSLLCTTIKASNFKKADIEAEIYDRISNTVSPLGFSVKSQLGNASTLLNASEATNFFYRVKNLDDNLIERINDFSTKSKVRDRIKEIIKCGGLFEFVGVAAKSFESNLKKIDTALPEFISRMLIDFFSGRGKKIEELVMNLSEDSALKVKYDLSHSDYVFKIKNFLQSAALGMVPTKIWDGDTKVHGGYIVVKNDGKIVCYHLYNRDNFLSYLYKNTKFESADTKRHNYGRLYKKGSEIFLNLNLQIRFCK